MKLTDKHGQQWQLVPIDPTESIERAYYWEQQKAGIRNCYPVYQAMLAAAPEPELSEGLDPIGYISAGGDVSRSKKYFDELGFVSEPLVLQSAALAMLAEKAERLAQAQFLLDRIPSLLSTISEKYARSGQGIPASVAQECENAVRKLLEESRP